MSNPQIPIIQIQGLDATELLNKLSIIQNSITTLENQNNPQPKTELLTRKQVCEILHISLVTLHNWVKNGVIIKHKIGNVVRFKRSEIEMALQQCK